MWIRSDCSIRPRHSVGQRGRRQRPLLNQLGHQSLIQPKQHRVRFVMPVIPCLENGSDQIT